MDRDDRRGYCAAAAGSLARASYDPKKLILIHTGATLLLSLLINVAGFLLEKAISQNTGLSGLGTRGILLTVRTVLNILPVLMLPFWQIGYVFATVQIARGKKAEPVSLLEGFRKFLPVLRLKLLLTGMYALLLFVAVQAGSMIFTMTPWAMPFMSAMMAYSADPGNAALEAALNAAASDAALPMLVILAVVFLAFAAPMYYRYRFAEHFLMERPLKGAFGAMRASSQITMLKRFGLFKLDLSFWWFYLLNACSVAFGYGDMILSLLGISLPFSEDVSYFLCLGLYTVTQLALFWWRQNEVSVTYAQVYADLQDPPPEATLEPKSGQWD